MDGEPVQRDEGESELLPKPERGRGFSERELVVHVPAEIRDVSFPLAMRGYDRPAVDAYVKRVNHLIAELEVSRSPRSAVRHALDRATAEVSSILQRAQETAEEITSSARKEAEEGAARAGAQAAKLLVDASDEAERSRADAEGILAKSRAEAEEILAKARAEAEAILAQSRAEAGERLQRSEKELAVLRELAEARMRDLQADTDGVWEERRELLDDIRRMGMRLGEVASDATSRFPAREPGERAESGAPEPEAAEPEPSRVAATDAPTVAMPGVASEETRDDEASDEEPA